MQGGFLVLYASPREVSVEFDIFRMHLSYGNGGPSPSAHNARHYCFFTALHTMQVGVSHKISVRPSLCLSNAGIVIERKKLLPKLLHRIKGPFI